VTSIDPRRPYLAEVRRGINGTRHGRRCPASSGIRPPASRAGCGGTGSDRRTHSSAWGSPLNRIPATGHPVSANALSFEPGYSWIFDGVSDADVIGDYGLSLGGAADTKSTATILRSVSRPVGGADDLAGNAP